MKLGYTSINESFDIQCTQSVVGSEWTLHQIAPYIGKVKSSIAKFLIENFTQKGDTIYDPFCGAGTIPFEGWTLGRNVIGNDLNRYAFILTKAKLFPPGILEDIIVQIQSLKPLVLQRSEDIKIEYVPNWVRSFFHEQTLKETIAWTDILKEKELWFLLSCMMGILHHQRPGFLSFPSSHTVPYLRVKNFPIKEFPELYEYRNVTERLIKKVQRALKRQPVLDHSLARYAYNEDASTHLLTSQVDAIITSPPYMRQLDYARDNRLRLWFLDVFDYKPLDALISPKEVDFIQIITTCLGNWDTLIKSGGRCILFLGDNYSKKMGLTLPEIIENVLLKDLGNFNLVFKHESVIPNNRRVRRNHTGNKVETVLVFEKK